MFTPVLAESIQLFPDGTIFIHIAIILLMIRVLNRTFFRPINRVIESREKFKNVEGGEAGSIQAEAAEKEARYNRELLDARAEGYAIVEDQHKKLVRAREKKLAETKVETDEKISVARGEIERDAEEARSAIASQADKLAEEIAATVIRS
jgi:F-type H+-transporting ATPase subunit b